MAKDTEEKIILDVDTQSSVKSLAELKAALKDAKGALLGAEEGTEEYNKALERCAELQHQQTVMTEQIKFATDDFGQKMSNVAGVAGAFTGAIGAVNGALKLMGSDAEVGTEAIAKMQSIMALTQGFQAIDQGSKAFAGMLQPIKLATASMGGFKKALIGTGIGAIVVLIGALIAHFDELTEALGITEEATAGIGKAFDKLKEIWAGTSKVLVNGVINFAKIIKTYFTTIGKGIKQLFTGDFSGLVDTFKNGFEEAKGYVKNALNVTEVYAEGVKQHNDKLAEEATKKAKEEAEKQAEENKKKWDKYVADTRAGLEMALKLRESTEKEGWKLTEEGKKYMDGYFSNLKKLYKADSKEYQQLLVEENQYNREYLAKREADRAAEEQKKLADEQTARNAELQALKNDLTKRQIALRENYLQGTLTKEEYTEQLKQLDNDYNQSYLDALQNQLTAYTLNEEQKVAITEKINSTLAAMANAKGEGETATGETTNPFEAVQFGLDSITQSLATLGADDSISKVIAQMGVFTKSIDTASGKIKQGKANWKDYSNMAVAGLNMIGGMLSSVAQQQDTNDKEGFERAKALNIAAAVMNTFSGAIAAYQSLAGIPMVGPVLGAVAAAAIATFGGIQIANIKKQKFGNGGGDTDTASATASIPQISTADLPTVSQPNEIATLTGNSVEEKINDTRVYVLENDITTTQNNVKTTVDESTF